MQKMINLLKCLDINLTQYLMILILICLFICLDMMIRKESYYKINGLNLIDIYLAQNYQQIDQKFIKMYQQRKSRIYLNIAWQKLKNKDQSFIESYATSIATYQFSWFHKIGIKQRLMRLFQ